MEFKTYRFDEVTINFDKKRIPLSGSQREKRRGTYRYYGAQGVIDYIDDYIFDGTYLLIAEDGENLKSKKQNIAQIATGQFWVNNHAHIVQGNELCDTRFLCYLLNSMDLSGYVTGSAQPKLSQANLNAVTINIPDISSQRKIVEYLYMIDQKIETNRRVNDNLQQQAQALYRSWFIDYTPFGGTVPADWCRGKLKDILQLQKRAIKAGAAPELPYLPIDTIPMKTFAVSDFRPNEEAQSSLIQFSKDDILIGAMRVYFHRVIIAPCDGITRTTCFVLKPTNHAYLSFGLLTCDLDSSIDHAQNTSKGSTMPYAVWDGGMGEIEIVIPPLEVAKEFNELVLPMLRQIQNSYFEVKALRELRDSLLPRLMSGNLDVSECF